MLTRAENATGVSRSAAPFVDLRLRRRERFDLVVNFLDFGRVECEKCARSFNRNAAGTSMSFS